MLFLPYYTFIVESGIIPQMVKRWREDVTDPDGGVLGAWIGQYGWLKFARSVLF